MAVSFKEKIKTLVQLIFEPKVLTALFSLRHSGYLVDKGWFNAFKLGKPVNEKLKPLPWLTYSFIDFLNDRLNKNINVLEFGSGNSTLYFAERVGQVTSVEHNLEWYKKLNEVIPENVKLIFSKSDSVDNYLVSVRDKKEKFDLILIDGVYRNECCYAATKMLSNSGVIILDDSEREEYYEGVNCILNEGFKRMDFWGISPGYLYQKATTVFYKSDNCLNI